MKTNRIFLVMTFILSSSILSAQEEQQPAGWRKAKRNFKV
jgi:hypothetical protein